MCQCYDRYAELEAIYPGQVSGIIHGKTKIGQKDQIMNDF